MAEKEQVSYLVCDELVTSSETGPPHSYRPQHGRKFCFSFKDDNNSPTVTRGVTITNLWQSAKVPVDNATDYFDGVVMVEPPETGAIFRLIECPPSPARHMHRTATLDYAMVLEGEIWGNPRTGKDCCEKHDTLSPTRHHARLAEPSDQPALLLFVLLDAEALPELPPDLSSLLLTFPPCLLTSPVASRRKLASSDF